jgi:hypothetical protein
LHLSPALAALAVVCGLAATSRGQDALIYAADSTNGQLKQVQFDPPQSTTFNTDVSLRIDLRSLTIRDDGVGGIHLIVCDTRSGDVLDYPGTGTGATIMSRGKGGPEFPDGVSLDPTGNLTVVSSTNADCDNTSQVWVILRDLGDGAGHCSLPGGYRTPLGLLDDDVTGVTQIGGSDVEVVAEHLEETLRVGTSAGALSAGDLLVVCSKPAMLLRYRAADVANYLAALRAQADAGTPPAELVPDVFVHPPQSSVDANRKFPDCAKPSGLAVGPDGNLLVPTADGSVLIFTPDGERRGDGAGGYVDFVQNLGDGKHKIVVGPQDGRFRAFLSDFEGNELLRFTIEADGTGTLDGIVSDGIVSPVGVATTTTTTVETKSGNNVVIQPSVVLQTTIPNVVTAGVTNARMVLFEDPREKELATPPEQPLHRSLFLNEISDDLPAVEIPAYVRAFPLGDPVNGPPTFILLLVDSTAKFTGPIVHDAEEALVLGYDPDCLSASPWLRPRIFWTPTPGELPILEGGRFIDITVRCGSDRGLTRNTVSLFMPGCRDTRDPVEISRTKLLALNERFCGATTISRKVHDALDRKLDGAQKQFEKGHYSQAEKNLDDFLSIVAANPDAFGASDETLPSELYSRAASAKFTIELL